MQWVPEYVHRHSVSVLRGWVIALGITVGIGTLILGAVAVGTLFSNSRAPIVVSSPRDCRLSEDVQAPKLYIAVDATAVRRGWLIRASTIGPSRWGVEAAGVVPSIASLSVLNDADFVRIVEKAEEDSLQFGVDETGIIVAIVNINGENGGSLDGLRTTWGLGEPAAEQDVPLGIRFTPTSCTVTTAG